MGNAATALNLDIREEDVPVAALRRENKKTAIEVCEHALDNSEEANYIGFYVRPLELTLQKYYLGLKYIRTSPIPNCPPHQVASILERMIEENNFKKWLVDKKTLLLHSSEVYQYVFPIATREFLKQGMHPYY